MAKPAKQKKQLFVELRPEYTAGEEGKLTRHWRTMFLDILAETSNVSEAARTTGINPRRAYKVRREDPDFAKAWHDALLEGYEHLELETLFRLRTGTTTDDPKFDMANALRLLAMHKETIARERARRGASSEAEVLASINAKIAEMRSRDKTLAASLKVAELSTPDGR